MPNEYAAVDSIIQFLYTHKNVKVDDVNYSSRMQAEQFNGAMPNEYAAADSVIQFLCTHKNVKVDEVNYARGCRQSRCVQPRRHTIRA
jgi:hypothetical protein